MRPKTLILYVKYANQRRERIVLEDVLFLAMDDMTKPEVEKTVFMVDVDKVYGNNKLRDVGPS